jgi:hypothetical protein
LRAQNIWVEIQAIEQPAGAGFGKHAAVGVGIDLAERTL